VTRAGDGAARAPSRGRATRRAFRPRRVVPAVVVAVLTAVAAFLVMVEVIAALVGRSAAVLPVTWLARLGRTAYWDDPRVLAGAAALAALGLFLLAVALWAGRPRAVTVRCEDPDVLMGLATPSVRRYAEDAATGVDGIVDATAVARRRRVRVRATSPLRDAEGLTDEVRRAVERRLDELALLRPPRLSVTVRSRGGGVT
jgi:uncharacterized protein DUF6286